MSNKEALRAGKVIEARALGKSFMVPTPISAVRKVDLDINAGELVALAGPSGSGKSTLLALLGGLLEPTEGSVVVCGNNLAASSQDERTRIRNIDIGFVFQFHHLLPELTALENVMLPGMISSREGWDPKSIDELRERSSALLDKVGVSHRAGHVPARLSGGEAQRVAVARALMNAPSLILADEPTGNLDQHTAGGILDLFENLNKETGQTFLIATHNPEIMKRASRTLNLIAGELAP